jgi:hypothetical protein
MALAAGRTPVRTCIHECEALTETLESEHPGLLIEQAILSAIQGQLDSPRAYLSAVVTRLCINHLRSARDRRETYVEALPEPLVAAAPGPA